MKAAAAPPPGYEDSDEERARKERERRAAQGKLYPLHPPRWLPPLLDDAEHGGGGGAEENHSVLAVYKYEDGSVYAGDWRRGMRSGWGVYDAAKPKVRYAGEWRTNRYDGLGIITYPTGNRYEGEFLGDQRHGRGLFLWKTTGEIYYGCWDMDVRSGLGCHHWPDGAKYEGEWAHGVPHGRGRYLWADGRRYEGVFTMGRRGGPPPANSTAVDDKRLGVYTVGKKFKGGCWEDGQCVKEVRLILEKNMHTKTVHPVGKIGNFLVQVQLLCEDARLMSVTTPLYAMNAKKAAAVAETRAAEAFEKKNGKQVRRVVMKASKSSEDKARALAAAAAGAKAKAAMEEEQRAKAEALVLAKSGALEFDLEDETNTSAAESVGRRSAADADEEGSELAEQDSLLDDSLFEEEEEEEEAEAEEVDEADKSTASEKEEIGKAAAADADFGSDEEDDEDSASDSADSAPSASFFDSKSFRSSSFRSSSFRSILDSRAPSREPSAAMSARGALLAQAARSAEANAAAGQLLDYFDRAPEERTRIAREWRRGQRE